MIVITLLIHYNHLIALEVLLNKDQPYGKHRIFEVDGNTYHCVESGSHNGKLILLLHGFPQVRSIYPAVIITVRYSPSLTMLLLS
jgi:hypothetical protein